MLAGAHLLSVPQLTACADILRGQTDRNCYEFAKLFGYSAEQFERIGDLESLLQEIMSGAGIRKSSDPLAYELWIGDYDAVSESAYQDTLPAPERLFYMSVCFVSDTMTTDLGAELEEIERRTPGLGAWILRQLDASPCNFLTPFAMHDEPEMFFGGDWYAGTDQEDPEEMLDNEDSVTQTMFMEYYPEWAINRHDDPEPDLRPWPVLQQVKSTLEVYNRISGELRKCGFDRYLIEPEGTMMYVGCIAWTKGRNEIERDIGWRCCNDTFHNMQYAEGAVPGCMQFEFVFTAANAERNRIMASMFGAFCRYLTALNAMITAVERSEIR